MFLNPATNSITNKQTMLCQYTEHSVGGGAQSFLCQTSPVLTQGYSAVSLSSALCPPPRFVTGDRSNDSSTGWAEAEETQWGEEGKEGEGSDNVYEFSLLKSLWPTWRFSWSHYLAEWPSGDLKARPAADFFKCQHISLFSWPPEHEQGSHCLKQHNSPIIRCSHPHV